ncbi:MAG: anthranilate synthase component I [Pirellulaceae bacterium]|nr:anthranilate synthase component I [Pirellulaceae bacterium]
MSVAPSFERFEQLAAQFDLVPLYRQLLSDSLTPVSAFKLLDDGLSPACLFESVIGGEKVGRYSFIAVHPHDRIAAYGDTVKVTRGGQEEVLSGVDPLDTLWKAVSGKTVAQLPELPGITGGAFGYAAYDVVRYVEELPNPPLDDRHLPDLDFSFFDDLVIFDNVNKTLYLVALVHCQNFPSLTSAWASGEKRLQELADKLQQRLEPLASSDLPPIDQPPSSKLHATSNFTPESFAAAIEKCTEYIRAGDIFQVVISQRFEMDRVCEPLEVYRSLRVVNPSPFMFFLRTPAVTLVGASPEVMCRVQNGVVTVRPLAGTRPRGKTPQDDARLAEELLADAKERAEHVMLVDLGRNDVGRVAKFGSVQLSDVMVIERYSHVMHISSNVDGILRDDMTAMDAMKACLPAGTVSGAPKVRAMEVIDEVEPHRRGPYAGAVGYIDYYGNMDTCIALRTLVFTKDKIYIQAGAGIVADSQAAAEYQETLNKAKAMQRAIEVTLARQT